ncbi:MAG: LLM class flavin-dependent oxidoreductase [Thermomicrobiales bacterium]
MTSNKQERLPRRSRVGISIETWDPLAMLKLIESAEAAGVEQLWLGQTSETPNALAIFAAAMPRTSTIRLGTAIVPIYPIHPLALARQAATVAAFGPGRLRLGIGPSTRSRINRVYGLPMEAPIERLEEYVAILRAVLWDGSVDFHGNQLTAKVSLDDAPRVPILTSALGESAFRLAGSVTDGAISWNCPPPYLLNHALPALIEGATTAGRPAPPLVAHVCVALTTDREEALAAGREHLSFYVKAPFYAAMFAAAGYPIPEDQSVPTPLIENLVIMGDEDSVAEQLVALLDSGLDELLISNLVRGDRTAADERLIRLVGGL